MEEHNLGTSYHIYMYKEKISNKYEHVCLKFMYNKAIKEKDNLEEVPLASPSRIYNFDEILTTVFNKMIGLQKITKDQDLYKKLKDNYIHHSSSIGDFVNKPSMENKSNSDFYGKRFIYGARGEEF